MTPHQVYEALERYRRICEIYGDYLITGDPDKFAEQVMGVMRG